MTSSSEPNVLVVDDNRANRKLASEFLKQLGVNATSAENGYEALDICRDTAFDLILMDIQMPGLSGIETTQKIRAQEIGKRTPIVALTAESVNDQKIQLLLADMDDFLSKPLSENDLKNTMDRWLHTPLSSSINDIIDNKSIAVTPKIATALQTDTIQDTPSSTTIFNLSDSLRLAKQLPDLAVDMLTLLLESIDETKQAMTHALSAGDLKNLLDVAHKFHGGCCYCGVPRLKLAVKTLETRLNTAEADDIEELVNKVLIEMDKLKEWANEHDIEALFLEV